jgi:hypothetical protein
MVSLSTNTETILQADRIPVFVGANRFYLKQGIQSSNVTIDTPNETVSEQGNEYNRGVMIQAPQVATSIEELLVDIDMDQVLAKSWATLGAVSGFDALSATCVAFAVGPSDNITKVIVSYTSGGYVRVGAGGLLSSVSTTIVKLDKTADNVNFGVGSSVVIQQENSATNSTVATVNVINKISGNVITLDTNAPALTGAGIYMYVKDENPILASNFVTNGYPNYSVKGIDVFCKSTMVAGNTRVHFVTIPVTPSGTSTAITNASMRNSSFDIIFMVNDYDNNLIKTNYLQDVGVTSLGFSFSTDGMARRTLDGNTGKQMTYVGYVLRNSMCRFTALASGTALSLATGPIFKGSETPDLIETNTTFNENSFEKSFLKIETINSSGVKTSWDEVAPTTSPSATTFRGTKKAFLSGTNIYFGTTLAANTRIELTYLCDATAVDSADAYQFGETAFAHALQPDSIDGRYVPVTINTTDFDSRIDGIESSDFSVALSRDFFNTQGKTAQRIKPSSSLELTGSVSSKEGFNQLYKVIHTGTNTGLVAGDQMDASKASIYTNTNTVPVRIRLYNPKDNVTEIATYKLPAIQITNVSNDNSVGSDSTFSFSFTEKKGKLEISR